MPQIVSKKLARFIEALSSAPSVEDENNLWEEIETPLVEAIPDDESNYLVTFLYRFETSSNKPNIYLYSTITGLACSEEGQFTPLSSNNLAYLSLTLPRACRTTYSLLIVDPDILSNSTEQEENIANDSFVPTGKFKASLDILNTLFQEKGVIPDTLNPNEITFYKDFENPVEYFAKESILTLPDAPHSRYLPSTQASLDACKQRLQMEQRLKSHYIEFSETNLADVPGYHEDALKAQRKYWIYLPPDYDKDTVGGYPLCLFLDGSSYLNTTPAQFMLEEMIDEGVIPACIAVFLDYSSENRIVEYNCNVQFTEFLAQDFLKHLKCHDQLNISSEPSATTIVGLSASGLAAIYAGLTYPTIFGNVIAQSASLEMKLLTDIKALIKNSGTHASTAHFVFNMGTFEKTPIELQFRDGTVQALSSYDANLYAFELMVREGMPADWIEFVGGHNDICWRECLPEQIIRILKQSLHIP